MNHLSTAELLLLAEGELDEVRAAHAAVCAECRVASEQAISELEAVTGVLASTGAKDSAEAKADSWVRLRASLAAAPKPQHVEIEDLLLHLDGETAPAVSEHLEACSDCHDDLLRAQTLLVDVEHELRALIPEESKQERLRSAARLEKALDARRSRVLTFPAPWRAVYAAAALAAAGLFGISWYAQQPAQLAPVMIASAPQAPAVVSIPQPAPRTMEIEQPAEPVAESAPVAVAAAETPVPSVKPERFDAPAAQDSTAPQRPALVAGAAPALAFVARSVALESELPQLERPAEQQPAQSQTLIALEPTRVVVNERPAGGIVRSALLEHYGDAARRSFRTARPDLLEGELARYVSDVLHAESELLRHAYALHELVKDADPATFDRKSNAEARKTLATIRQQEELLYSKLSEALPRRFWATKGQRDADSEEVALRDGSAALLEAALKLDKGLSAIFVEADSAVALETEPASLGDLLYTVRSSSRNLQQRLSVLR